MDEGRRVNLSTHEAPAEEDNGYDVASYMPLGLDGYAPIAVPSQWEQTGTYRLPLMSPSRGHIVRRRDVVEEISSRPNNPRPSIWSTPVRGRIVTNTNGAAQAPLASYAAGQVNVNAFLANSDLSQAQAAQFVASRSARYTGPNLAQTGGD